MKVKHEGIFGCTYQSGFNEGKSLFEVIVYVTATPVVNGCPTSQYCVIEVQTEGNLTCSVTGIRPVVQLDWSMPYEEDSSVVTFSEREVLIKSNGDVYDIYMTSYLQISKTLSRRVTVQCEVAGTNIEALKTKTTFDLLLKTGEPETLFDIAFMWLGITTCVLIFVMVPICYMIIQVMCSCCKYHSTKERTGNRTPGSVYDSVQQNCAEEYPLGEL